MNQTNPTRALFLSVIMGVFAMFLIYTYSQDKQAELNKEFGAKTTVFVAKRDILEMSTIDETMLEGKEVPNAFKQPGAITDAAEALSLVAAAPFKQGEQILATKLLSPGAETGLAFQVAPGKRAVTIPIDDSRGVAKLLRPGDRVDLITAIDPGRGAGSKIEVKTMMQNVTVLATGINVTNSIPRKLEINASSNSASFRRLSGDTSFSNVTVEVTPKEAQDLIVLMATSPGSIFLSLRNPNDVNTETLSTSNVNTVLGRLGMGFIDEQTRLPAAARMPPPIVQPVARPAPKISQPKKKHGTFIEYN